MNEYKCTNQHYQLFESELQCILAHVKKELLTFEEMYLIYYQSNIKFHTQDQHAKLKQHFNKNNNLLPLRQCLALTQLLTCQVIHNRPQFYVVIAGPDQHHQKVCFTFWKQTMNTKFGSQMRWFDMIAGQMQARKIKSFEFKNRIKHILKATPHEGCAQSICRKFPKNRKNEIEWGTFMAVIRYIDGKYNTNNSNINNNNKTSTILSQLTQQKQQLAGEKIKSQIEANKSTKSVSKRPSHRIYKQSQRTKQNKSKNKLSTSYHQCDTTSNPHEDDYFQMKSSLEIDREYKAITRKFNLHDQENLRIARSRAKSAKNTKNTSTKIDTSTSVNWRESQENIEDRINLIESRYGIYVNRQKISASHHPNSISSKTHKLQNNYFSNYAKPRTKQITEPVYIDDQF